MNKNANLTEFTFPVSGIKVHVPHVSPAGFMMRLIRKYPPPNPPQQEVDYGGRIVVELNYAHPDYAISKEVHEKFLEEKAQNMVLVRAIRAITLNREQRSLVEDWKDENPDLWEPVDKDQEIFFDEFCIADEEDLTAFISHVTGIDPTEAEVKASVDGFQGDVSGNAHLRVGDTQVGDQVRQSAN